MNSKERKSRPGAPSSLIGPVRPVPPAGTRGRSSLLALSSLAVLAVYSAGYVRTYSAAQRFEGEGAGRRPRLTPALPANADGQMASISVLPAAPLAATDMSSPAEPVALPAPVPTVAPAAESPAIASASRSSTGVTPWVATATVIPVVDPILPATPAAALKPPAAATPAPAVIAGTEIISADGPAPKWKDGKYSGWGSCRHGDIEATVEIRGGKIVSSVISKCRTVYSCDVIADVIPQVVKRQSPDVDSVSGATQSADSYYWAVYSALAEAEIKPAAAK